MNWTTLKAQVFAVGARLKEEHQRNNEQWIRRFESATTSE
jgi:hypothetical protein